MNIEQTKKSESRRNPHRHCMYFAETFLLNFLMVTWQTGYSDLFQFASWKQLSIWPKNQCSLGYLMPLPNMLRAFFLNDSSGQARQDRRKREGGKHQKVLIASFLMLNLPPYCAQVFIIIRKSFKTEDFQFHPAFNIFEGDAFVSAQCLVGMELKDYGRKIILNKLKIKPMHVATYVPNTSNMSIHSVITV